MGKQPNNFDTLLAKRPSNPLKPEETLVGHTQRVCETADALCCLLAPHLQEMGAVPDNDINYWKQAVHAGAWMHDWGKANNHFQTMLRQPQSRQGVRHETVTVLLVEKLGKWLEDLWRTWPHWAKFAALVSASGHHLKFPDPDWDTRDGSDVTILIGHPDFLDVLKLKASHFGLPCPPAGMANYSQSRFAISKALNQLHRMWDTPTGFAPQDKLLIAAAKCTVMAADLAGSALPSHSQDPSQWLKNRLTLVLSKQDLQNVVNNKLQGASPRQFQQQVQSAQGRTVLVQAGCGSGKTAAAYLWASQNGANRRLFFCYPTTGTATEGFAGYLQDPDFDAILIHSRAQVDYQLLANMPNPTHEENELRAAGLEALETWPIPAVVCTAHTVLGLLENVRRGIYAFPSFLQSVFIFDEVHAYSDRLFTYLLRFLEALPGARVLLMSATLPPSRLQALQHSCAGRGGLDIIQGPPTREQAERYVLRRTDRQQVWQEIDTCVQNNGKVLWVCNTVATCMDMLDEAMKRGLRNVQPYHSRYRYKDRLVRHRTVVDGFKNKDPMIAITTQVAEMSLDLSADLLISEVAPVPAMIQRMGRLNRFDEQPPRLGTALFLEPEDRYPYEEDDLHTGNKWLDALIDGQPKSQKDLADEFVNVASQTHSSPPQAVSFCEWLDGEWKSRKDQQSIEEAGYTIEVVREEDLGQGSNVAMAIPMPIPKRDFRQWDRSGRFLVAPKGTINYDELRGAQWK